MTNAALTKAVKEAVSSAMREQREMLAEVVAEAIEDVAMAAAIREGGRTKRVPRERVMQALRRGRK
jgi:hypothetical protein